MRGTAYNLKAVFLSFVFPIILVIHFGCPFVVTAPPAPTPVHLSNLFYHNTERDRYTVETGLFYTAHIHITIA